MKHKYDLRRCPEFKGLRYRSVHHVIHHPPLVDLRAKLPPAFDQGQEGSCGPNSADALMCFLYPQVHGFSRQQIYYKVRQMEDDVGQDAGVQTIDLLKELQANGAAPENLWPYIPENLMKPPPPEVMAEAEKYRIHTFSQLASEQDFLDCLAEGFPFILGITVYESLEEQVVEQTGVYARPNPLTEQVLGGHDITVVGYDTNFHHNPDFLKSGISKSRVDTAALLIRNSWGTQWGIHGHFWLPISYAASTQTGGDAWTGRLK